MLRFVPVDQGTGVWGRRFNYINWTISKQESGSCTKTFLQDLKVIRKLQMKFILAAIILRYLWQDSGLTDRLLSCILFFSTVFSALDKFNYNALFTQVLLFAIAFSRV